VPNFTANTTLSAASLNTAFNQADVNVQTGTTYTLLEADQGKLITLDNASPVTLTIPLNSSAALPVNTVIGLLNKGAGLVTISPISGVTLSPAVRILATNEAASLIKTATDTWYFVQGGGLPKAIVSSSTAASVTAVTVGGLPAKVYRFTGTGSITFSKAGLVDVIAQGPGGLGSFGCGGAGGFIEKSNVFVSAGSNAVYIGAGGSGSLIQGTSESSHFSGIAATGGGSGAQYTDRQPSGGACGGGSGPFASANSGVGARFQGLIVVSAGVTRGGNGAGVNGGGGGGVNGDGSGGTGGAGTTPDATWGSPGTLGRGGGGASMTANTGNGGNLSANGNSGIILVRVLD
jgi:hypothetical protein